MSCYACTKNLSIGSISSLAHVENAMLNCRIGTPEFSNFFLGHGIGHALKLVTFVCQQSDESVLSCQMGSTYDDQHVLVLL